MTEPATLITVAREFRRYNLHILGLSETRWNGYGEHKLPTNETLLYSGKENVDDTRSEGVGLLLSSSAKSCLLKWTPVNQRMLVARFKSRARNISIVQCYAPTEAADPDRKDEFYTHLQNTLLSVPSGDITIVMGDLNAQVGGINTGLEHVMGKHALGKINDNGLRFVEACANHQLVIGGSLFPHKEIHKQTWISNDQRTKNQIDHIAISCKWRGSLLDVRSKRGADAGTDHHLVVASVRPRLEAIRKKSEFVGRRFDVSRLQDEGVRDRVSAELANGFQCLSEDDDIDEYWKKFESSVATVCRNVLGYASKAKAPWISSETLRKIDDRKNLKGKLNACSEDTRHHFQDLYKRCHVDVKRSVRRDKRFWTDELANEAEGAYHRGDMKTVFTVVRALGNKRSKNARPVKDAQGTVLTAEDEQLKRWAEHFDSVLNNPVSSNALDAQSSCTARLARIDVAEPSWREIVEAIKSLKTGKSPGSDGIPAEIMRLDVGEVAHALHPLIRKIWATGSIPAKWKEGLIVKIPKKGDLSVCGNWRGVTLLSIPSKVLSRIILNRISAAVEKNLRNEQAGFRPGRSCTDQTNTLRIILEQAQEYQSPLYTVFVDFEKAFDSVDRNKLWSVLSNRGIPAEILNIIKGMYDGFNCKVVHNGKLSASFQITTGVRQGCILSPVLFILLLDEVLRNTTAKYRRGISWGPFGMLEDLDYADDICLLSHRYEDMQAKLEKLWNEGLKVGLKINKAKTCELRVRGKNTRHLSIDAGNIAQVDSFCYLGSMITADGGCDLDVDTRIRKARGMFAFLGQTWRSTQLSRNTKLRVFNATIVSILLYGCETWKTTNTISSKLQVFINGCLRRILRVRMSEGISNNALWLLANMDPIPTIILRRKWRWLGHTQRRPVDDITRSALKWNPQGSRKRGRPKQTWRRTLHDDLDKAGYKWCDFEAQAPNRVRFRAFVDALCSTGS